MSESCLFCQEVTERPDNVFYEEESGLFVARWDNFPSTPGHAEVIPTRHFSDVVQLNDEERIRLIPFVIKVADVIAQSPLKEVYRKMLEHPVNEMAAKLIEASLVKLQNFRRPPDAFNHGINDGEAAGRTVHHLHYHLMPRWNGDVDNPRGGIRHMFEIGGDYTKG